MIEVIKFNAEDVITASGFKPFHKPGNVVVNPVPETTPVICGHPNKVAGTKGEYCPDCDAFVSVSNP